MDGLVRLVCLVRTEGMGDKETHGRVWATNYFLHDGLDAPGPLGIMVV